MVFEQPSQGDISKGHFYKKIEWQDIKFVGWAPNPISEFLAMTEKFPILVFMTVLCTPMLE